MTPFATLRRVFLLWLCCALPLTFTAGWVSHIVYRDWRPVVQRVVGTCGELRSSAEEGTR